jgi:type I restriction enzyme S subunit
MSKKGEADMSYSLKYETFGSLLKNVVDNRGKTCPTADSGIPLIATNCIVNNYLYPIYEKVRYITEETYKTWFRDHPKPGDMIFVLKGTPGRVAWVPDPVDFCIAQDMVAIRADERKIFPKYLFAVLRSDSIQQEIEGLHVGSLIPHFKKGDFDELKIPIVEPKLQEFIGNQYFDLSLKIDLLHRQNKTLEALAETLFRLWFVEEAEEGWGMGKLGDYTSVTTGKGLKRHEFIDNGIYPVFGANGEIGRTNNYLTEDRLILTGRVGTLGKVIISEDKVWISDNVLIVKPHAAMYFYPIYFNLKRTEFENLNVGSTQPLVTQTDLKNIDFSLPSGDILKSFENHCSVYYEKKSRNDTQIRTLTRLRDTLLPKLMSGEVRMKLQQQEAGI